MRFRPDDARITAAIQKAASTWGAHYGVTVPVELVRAMIVRESGVRGSNPVVVDTLAKRTETAGPSKGHTSYGLLQLLDSTAADLGLKGDPTALYIPEIGISYGVKYLAKQIKRYGGDLNAAVAAYNAGTAYRKPDGKFVNQGYLDFVMGKWQEFSKLAGEVATSPLGIGLLVAVVIVVVLVARKRAA